MIYVVVVSSIINLLPVTYFVAWCRPTTQLLIRLNVLNC